jgi:hypothetical protein
MACDRMRELALLDVDDALSAAERAELDLHLVGCAECRAARDSARRVARGLRQIPVPPVPLGFSERTLQRIERAATVAARPRRRPLRSPPPPRCSLAPRSSGSSTTARRRRRTRKSRSSARRRAGERGTELADGDGADATGRKQAPQDEEKARTNEKARRRRRRPAPSPRRSLVARRPRAPGPGSR